MLRWFKRYPKQDMKLAQAVTRILGEKPDNISLYRLAMLHSSLASKNDSGFKESNERLEYLGDSVLGMIVAEYLFKRYPFKDEGFLTEIRSRIVNRESLNKLSIKLGISTLIKHESGRNVNHAMYGDAMEAFIGAMYLDKGFHFSKKYILKLLQNHFDIQDMVDTTDNYKSLIIEWAQRNNKEILFDSKEERVDKYNRQYKVSLSVNGEVLGEGYGRSKKKAEQDASRIACAALTEKGEL